MNDVIRYKNVMDNIEHVYNHISAKEIIDAYHELEKGGGDELDDLCFEYARGAVRNMYVANTFVDHLYSCEDCRLKLRKYKYMFEVLDKYGNEALDIVNADELVEKGKVCEEEGNRAEAIKNYREALKYSPENEYILGKINELEPEDKKDIKDVS